MTSIAPNATRAGLRVSWAVFAAAGLLGLGHGLQGTLLGVRGTEEGFDTAVIGLIMTSYYVGFIFGSRFTVRALGRVGHIRVFAALASTASSAALVYAMLVHPVAWFAMRLLTGFCLAGLYVVIESWLNDQASNETRGRALSMYMIVTMGAVACSQVVLGFGSTSGASLFMVASVMVSMSLVPMALSEGSAPVVRVPEPLSLGRLWSIVPTGVVVIFLTGVSVGALRGLGPTYAAERGLSIGAIGAFVAATTLGASLLQYPIGALSDRLPRRSVMIGVSAAAGALSLMLSVAEPTGLRLTVAMFLLGGLGVPMYSLAIAYTNDWLDDDVRVGGAALLIVVNGAGAIFGPLVAGVLMQLTSPAGFFVTLWVIHAAVVVYLLYRLVRARAPAIEDQAPFVALSNRGAGLVTLRELRRRRRPPEP